MDEGDTVADPADDIVGGKKLAHGGVRGLQLRDHLAALHLLQQLLQAPVKDDGIIVHYALSVPFRSRDIYVFVGWRAENRRLMTPGRE